jgi:hypothetical protein
MHVFVGHHCAAAIPSFLADDVNTLCIEGIGCSHDSSDVQIVLPILDRNMKRMSVSVEVSDDCLVRPIAIPITHISAITVFKKFGIKPWIIRPRSGKGTNSDFAIFTFDELITIMRIAHRRLPTKQSGTARIIEQVPRKCTSRGFTLGVMTPTRLPKN